MAADRPGIALASSIATRAVLLAVGAAAALLRVTNAGSRYALWGEDGNIFTQQPRTDGVARSFSTTYAGYFHLLPRTVGAIASVLPLRWVPYLFTGAAGVIAAACAVVSWRAVRAIGLSEPASALVGLSVLLLPAGGFEIVDNTTNCQWFVLAAVIVFVAAWMVDYRPPVAPCVALLVVAGMTSPLIGVTLPFVGIVAFKRRHPSDFAVLASIGLTAVVQIGAGFVTRHQVPRAHPTLSRIVHVYAFRVVGGGAFGDRFLFAYQRALNTLAVVVVAVVAVLGLACAVLRRRPLWLPAAFVAVESGILFVAAAFTRPDVLSTSATEFAPSPFGNVVVQGRYMAVPGVLLVVAAIILVDQRRSDRQSVHAGPFNAAAFVLACLSLAANYPIKSLGVPLGTWRTDIVVAEKACRSDPSASVVLPTGPSPPWKVTISCHQAFHRNVTGWGRVPGLGAFPERETLAERSII